MPDSHDNTAANASGQGEVRFGRASMALFAAGFATFSMLYCVQPLMPLFSDYFGVSPAVSSLSLSLATGVLAFAILAAGLMSEALERKRTMGLCLAAASVLSLMAALAPTWELLLAARALSGIVLGGVPALALAYLAEETQPAALGFATGLYIGGNAIGGMAGRVIGGVMADVGGWRLAFAAMGILGVVATLIFVRLLPASRHFRPRRGLSPAQHFEPMAAHLRHPALPWLFVCAFVLMGGFVTVYNYLAYRLSAPPFLLDPGAIGGIFVVYLCGTLASTAAGRMADRHGRPLVLATGLGVMLVGLGLTLAPSLAVIIMAIALFTSGFFAAHATASGWTGQLAGHGKGQAAGLYLLAYYLGSSIIGSLGGLFWAYAGWPGVTGLVVGLMLLAWVALIRLWLWQRRHEAGAMAARTPSPTSGTTGRMNV